MRFTNANRKALDNLQYSLGELCTLTPIDIKPDFDAEEFRGLISGLISGTQGVLSFETKHQRSDGSTYDARVSLELVEGRQPQFLALILDVSAENTAKELAASAQFQLQSAIEALPDAFVLYDRSDRLVLCNERYREFYSKSAPAMVVGARFKDILQYGLERGEYSAAVGRERQWLAERLRAHRKANSTVEQRLSDGRCLRIIERQTPEGGRVGLRIDITELVESRARAIQAEQRLSDAIDALPAAFWLFDKHDRLVMQNDRNKELLCSPADINDVGVTYTDILRKELSHGQYVDALGREEDWLSGRIAERTQDSYALEYERSDGRWIRSLNQRTSEGGHVGFRIDISEAKKKHLELEAAALSDPLTGLANRRAVSIFLAEAAKQLHSDERLFFLHIDLDKFKAINDTIGHDAGDFVIEKVAQILKSGVRESDLVARVGGDEFLIASASKASNIEVVEFADRLRIDLSEQQIFKGRVCHVGASIGISSWSPEDQTSLDQALVDADIALNSSKVDGRNKISLFEEHMRSKTVQTARQAQEIADGLKNNEFTTFFQPQLDVLGRRVVGFESLVRWQHPRDGLISAGSFVAVAEEAGLLPEIDRVVLRQALSFAAKLKAFGRPDIRVSLNLSSAQLHDPNIVEDFKWNVSAHDLSPRQIGIEVLETTLLDERSSQAVKSVCEFAEAGFPIELDDFGTGHTAISNLRNLPVERIKIDRSLFSSIDSDTELYIITDAVVGLGRKLNLHVLAEGIETEGERMAAEAMGCTCVQGYLFAKALAPNEAIEWVESRTTTSRSAGSQRCSAEAGPTDPQRSTG